MCAYATENKQKYHYGLRAIGLRDSSNKKYRAKKKKGKEGKKSTPVCERVSTYL